MKLPIFGLVALCLACFATGVFADEPIVVEATFQDRTYFSAQGADVQIAFIDNSITTLIFRVYDNALLDTPFEQASFDGLPHDKPRIDPGTSADNAYRENVRLTFNTSTNTTVGKWKVVPVYQTKTGARVYYIFDSYRETGAGNKRCSFLVQPPAAK